MIGKTLLVVNPRSGKGAAKRVLLDIVTRLSGAGSLVTVLPTKKGMQTAESVCNLLQKEPRFDLVVACGGDGTLNLTVEGILRSGRQVPVGYIPLGTTNDFASSMDIPSDYRDAAALVVAGNPTPHDVGLFNDRHFTYIACCGAFTQSSYSTNQTLKNLLGHAAYVFSALPSLSSLRPIPLTVTLENETITGDFLFCSLSNTTTVGGIVQLDGKQVNFNDGLFELVLIRYPQDLAAAGRVAARLLNADLDDPLIVLRHVSSCMIQTDTPIGWSLDGEDGGKTAHALLSIEKSALQLLK